MLNPISILYGIITGLILGFLRIDVHLVPYLVAAFVFGYLIHTLVMYFEKDISNKKYIFIAILILILQAFFNNIFPSIIIFQ